MFHHDNRSAANTMPGQMSLGPCIVSTTSSLPPPLFNPGGGPTMPPYSMPYMFPMQSPIHQQHPIRQAMPLRPQQPLPRQFSNDLGNLPPGGYNMGSTIKPLNYSPPPLVLSTEPSSSAMMYQRPAMSCGGDPMMGMHSLGNPMQGRNSYSPMTPNTTTAARSPMFTQVHLQQPTMIRHEQQMHSPIFDDSSKPLNAGEQHRHLSPHSPSSSTASTSAANSTTPTSDPCSNIVHVLQCYQQGGETQPDFVRKAIESLVKKVKDRRHELDALIAAITSGGKTPTSCVTIQRSLDGRLQVAGRKGVPHVVYAQIWRWPNVRKNELQKLPICGIPMDHADLICVNPYHYERVVSSPIGNLDLATLRLEPPTAGNMPSLPSCAHVDEAAESGHNHRQQPWMAPCAVASSSGSRATDNYDQTSRSDYSGIEPNLVQSSSAPHVRTMQPAQQQQQMPQSRPFYDLESVQLPYVSNYPEHWCSITYYELDTQVGETFKVRSNQLSVTIDGGVHPAGARAGRFCIGALPNVHRCEASEKARLHIGKGVRLTYNRDDGSVGLDCLSQKIFDLRWAYEEMRRQSESAQMAVVAQAAAVAGYVQGAAVPSSLIEHAGTGELKESPRLGSSCPRNKKWSLILGVDDLRRVCCTLAFSFVKGYGENYNRKTIKETPCWVEVQLHRPLQLLDQVLHKLQGSDT